MMADDEDPRQVDQLSNPSSGSGTKPEPSARIADAIARWRQMQASSRLSTACASIAA